MREIAVAKTHLSLDDEATEIFQVMGSLGPGNVFTIEVHSDNITEMFIGFGELRKSAEAVAHEAIEQAKKYLESSVPVGSYLADQLLIPFALAKGGQFKTSVISSHTRTNIEVIHKFLGPCMTINNVSNDKHLISIVK